MRQTEIEREGKTTIAILDACRDNPLARNPLPEIKDHAGSRAVVTC